MEKRKDGIARRSKFDLLDRKLLSELDFDARRSFAELGRTLRQSRERIEYRVNRLIEDKVISYFETTINPQRLGYDIYKTYLRVENNRPKVAEMVAHLRQHPRLAWLALCDGTWDIAFCLYARTPTEFHDMHVQLLSLFNPVILNFSSYTIIRIKMYKRGYFGARRGEHVPLGGFSAPISIDKLDLEILESIRTHARIPVSELASKVKTTPTIAQYRLTRMERLGLISGYRIELNLPKVGMMFMKTQFFLRSYDIGLRQAFQEYCDANPYITCFTEQIGDCNVELELHVPDYETYSEVIDEIRARESKLIKTFNTLLVRKSWYSWMPADVIAA